MFGTRCFGRPPEHALRPGRKASQRRCTLKVNCCAHVAAQAASRFTAVMAARLALAHAFARETRLARKLSAVGPKATMSCTPNQAGGGKYRDAIYNNGLRFTIKLQATACVSPSKWRGASAV